MGKRSDFERIERDFYPTPYAAVQPLLNNFNPVHFYEPCCGKHDLINHLEANKFVCTGYSDVEKDATKLTKQDIPEETVCFITNPPWDRKVLHPIIDNLSVIRPTWLLFDADWMHTKQSIPFLSRLHEVISVGRVKWFPETNMTGKDNCCWYLFSKPKDWPIHFIGRQ